MKVKITFSPEEEELIRTVLRNEKVEGATATFTSEVGGHVATVKFPVGEKHGIEVVVFPTEEGLCFTGTAKDFGIDLNPPQMARRDEA